MTLTDLARRVESFAELCLPDYRCDADSVRGVEFIPVDLGEISAGETTVGVRLHTNGSPGLPHVFTDWARTQLLAHMGTKEKWFLPVGDIQQAEELQKRVHTLSGHRLRAMRSIDLPEVAIIRGLVSSYYADIPDTDIMRALLETIPGALVIRSVSGKTDRASYAYIVSQDPVGIPGTDFLGFPGTVVRNSEVGFTSLWVVPFLYVPEYHSVSVLEANTVLRRVHRGTVSDLSSAFSTALQDVSILWANISNRLTAMSVITFPSEDEAVEALRKLLKTTKAPALFIHKCALAYKAAGNISHTALKIYEAVLGQVRAQNTADEAYAAATISGAVLLSFL